MKLDHTIEELMEKGPNGHEIATFTSGNHQLTSDEKIEKITYLFGEIMRTLGLNTNEEGLTGTPARVAKMFVNEIFKGLDPNEKPEITLFDNNFNYSEMIIEKNIQLYSNCEHHFVPIVGKAHVAYIPDKKVIGLSKMNRIVDYYARRPQIQERLTIQIADELKTALKTENVGVVIEAVHFCVAARGVKDVSSNTTTSDFSGAFLNERVQDKFFTIITS